MDGLLRQCFRHVHDHGRRVDEAIDDMGRRATFQMDGRFDHLVILTFDQIPPNRPRHDGCQLEKFSNRSLLGQIRPFVLDAIQATHQPYAAEQATKCKDHLGLTMRIREIIVRPHVRVMAHEVFDNGRTFRRRKAFGLGHCCPK